MVKKLIQNIVTGSRLTLPITIVYTIGIWLLCQVNLSKVWFSGDGPGLAKEPSW